MLSLVRHLDDHLHLDDRAGGQGIHPDGSARMAATFTEDGDQQIGAAVQDLGLLGKSIGTLDKTSDADDAADLAKIADLGFQRGQQLQPAGSGRGLSLLFRNGRRHLACDHLAVGGARNLSREEHQVPAAHGRNVVGHDGSGRRQRQPQLRESGLGVGRGGMAERRHDQGQEGEGQEARDEFHGGKSQLVGGSRPSEQRQKTRRLTRCGWVSWGLVAAFVLAATPALFAGAESPSAVPEAGSNQPSVVAAHDLILSASINRSYVIGSKMVTLSGLHRRVDDGSFEHFGPNLLHVSAAAFDPRDHKMIYLATLNGALFSRNGGERFRIATSWDMTEPKDIAVDPNAPDTVYLALPDGFAVSTDRGWTWSRREKGLPDRGKYTQAIEVDRTRTGRLLIGCEAGVFLSENGGARWRRVLATRATVYDVRQSPTDPSWWIASTQRDGVHVSRDAGVTWSKIADLAEDGAWYNVEFGVRQPNRLALSSWNQGLVVSEDGGRTWTPRNAGLPAEGRIMRVAIDPDTDSLYVSVRGEDVYRSEDFGRTWNETGLKGSTVAQFLFVKKLQP